MGWKPGLFFTPYLFGNSRLLYIRPRILVSLTTTLNFPILHLAIQFFPPLISLSLFIFLSPFPFIPYLKGAPRIHPSIQYIRMVAPSLPSPFYPPPYPYSSPSFTLFIPQNIILDLVHISFDRSFIKIKLTGIRGSKWKKWHIAIARYKRGRRKGMAWIGGYR